MTLAEVLDARDDLMTSCNLEKRMTSTWILLPELDEDDELEEIESASHNFSYFRCTYIHRYTSIIKKKKC